MTNGKIKEAAAHGHPPPNIGLYLGIFGALLALTVLTVLVSYWHLPPGPAIFVGLVIAAIKASLVAAFFMHLKGEHRLIYYCLGIMLFCCIGFFLVPLDMHMVRDRATHTEVAESVHEGGEPEGSTHEMNTPSEKTQEQGEDALKNAQPKPSASTEKDARPEKAAPKKKATKGGKK
jgi:cytochrome c oxidase subunit 4